MNLVLYTIICQINSPLSWVLAPWQTNKWLSSVLWCHRRVTMVEVTPKPVPTSSKDSMAHSNSHGFPQHGGYCHQMSWCWRHCPCSCAHLILLAGASPARKLEPLWFPVLWQRSVANQILCSSTWHTQQGKGNSKAKRTSLPSWSHWWPWECHQQRPD